MARAFASPYRSLHPLLITQMCLTPRCEVGQCCAPQANAVSNLFCRCFFLVLLAFLIYKTRLQRSQFLRFFYLTDKLHRRIQCLRLRTLIQLHKGLLVDPPDQTALGSGCWEALRLAD